MDEELKEKLDTIIGLLMSLQPNNKIKVTLSTDENAPECNCHLFNGATTAGWHCPAHGQRFNY